MSDFNQTLEVFVRQRVQELLPGAVNTALGNVFINVGKQLKEQATGNAAPVTGAVMSPSSNPDRYKSQSEKMKENWIKRKAKAAAEKAAAAAAAGTPIPAELVSTETPEEAESTNEPVASEEPAE